MKRSIAITLVTSGLLMTGCGGSSSGSSNTTTVKGSAADGYLVKAKVCLDLNDNMNCDAGEPSDITKEHGTYSFKASNADIKKHSIIVDVDKDTIDEDTNKSVGFSYTMSGAPGQTFISPISTMVRNYMYQNGVDYNKSVNAIASKLGIVNKSELEKDYIKSNKKDIHKIAQVIARLKSSIPTKLSDMDSQIIANTRKDVINTYINNEIQNKLEEIAQEINTGSNDTGTIADNYLAVLPLTNYAIDLSTIKKELDTSKTVTPKPIPTTTGNDPKPAVLNETTATENITLAQKGSSLYDASKLSWVVHIPKKDMSWYKYSVKVTGGPSYEPTVMALHSKRVTSSTEVPESVYCDLIPTMSDDGEKIKSTVAICEVYDKNRNLLYRDKSNAMTGITFKLEPFFDYVTADGNTSVTQQDIFYNSLELTFDI